MRTGVLATLLAALAFAAAPARGEAELEGQPEREAAETFADEGAEEAFAGEEEPPPPGGVARATFTTAVVEREPQDFVTSLTNDRDLVFYFTELRDLEGQTVTHRWTFQGDVMAEVPIEVSGPRWRAYSSKNMDPQWLGEWMVSVVDEWGRTLTSDSFRYVAAPEPPAQARPAAPPGLAAEEAAPPAAPQPPPAEAEPPAGVLEP